jgi:hypothetical protein
MQICTAFLLDDPSQKVIYVLNTFMIGASLHDRSLATNLSKCNVYNINVADVSLYHLPSATNQTKCNVSSTLVVDGLYHLPSATNQTKCDMFVSSFLNMFLYSSVQCFEVTSV